MDTFEDLYREFTQPRDFAVALCCPDCKTQLVEYSCPACKANGNRGGVTGGAIASSFLILLSYSLPVFLGVIGFLLFKGAGAMVGFVLGLGIAKVMISDLRREQYTERAKLAALPPAILLAERYQKDPATYDQAAKCY